MVDNLRTQYQFDLSKPVTELIRLEKLYCAHVTKLVKLGTLGPTTKDYLLNFLVVMFKLLEHYKTIDPEFGPRLLTYEITHNGKRVNLKDLLTQYHIQVYHPLLSASLQSSSINNEYSNIWLDYITLRKHVWALALGEFPEAAGLYNETITPF
jgi:hypothetical protein